jgi:hypothetical protein
MIDLMKVVSAARSATSKLVELGARGLGDEASDGQSEAADQIAFLSPLGLLVMPRVQRSLRAIVARVGGPVEAVALALWDKDLTHEPAPSAGETRVYSAGFPGVCLRLLEQLVELRLGGAAGVVKLAPDGAGWRDRSVARVEDTTENGTLTIVAAGATPTFTITATYTPPGGGAPLPMGAITITDAFMTGLAGTITVPITGKITSGSSSVKA